ncbi:hypothetical protein [Endozoicomonas acroporae]|uniref:hypothetical protein n=1 Tax=Endozoicomonas acroporae TaxID=1701104 RepID=UPI003D79F254
MIYTSKIVAIVCALSMSIFASAEIFKCKIDDSTVFSDKPCGTSLRKVVLKQVSTMQGMSKEGIEQSNKNTKAILIEDKIDRAEEQIKSYEKMMDQELASLKRKKLRANNNLAGATWEESISTEMKSVTEKYNVRIEMKRDEIKQLRDDLKNL